MNVCTITVVSASIPASTGCWSDKNAGRGVLEACTQRRHRLCIAERLAGRGTVCSMMRICQYRWSCSTRPARATAQTWTRPQTLSQCEHACLATHQLSTALCRTLPAQVLAPGSARPRTRRRVELGTAQSSGTCRLCLETSSGHLVLLLLHPAPETPRGTPRTLQRTHHVSI